MPNDKYHAEQNEHGQFNVYRIMRINGETEHVYMATVDANNAADAIVEATAACKLTANVRWATR